MCSGFGAGYLARVIALVCACGAPGAGATGSEVAATVVDRLTLGPTAAPVEVATPAPSAAEPLLPVTRQWFVTDDAPVVGALPPSRQSSTRMSQSRVLIDVRPHATRSDSASVVIDDGVIDDVRSVAGKLLLSRWIDAKFLEPGIGMGREPAGFVVAATVEIDTDVIVELLALASGATFDGPVELALRRGTEVTTIPIVLGEQGIAPVPGKWGAWARELEDAWLASTGTAPLVLALGDVVGDAYRYRKQRSDIGAVARIGRIETSGALQPSLARRIVRAHRNEISSCYVQALVVRPSLAGTWKVSTVLDAEGRPQAPTIDGSADERLQPCIASVMQRWKFPASPGSTTLSVAFDLTPES